MSTRVHRVTGWDRPSQIMLEGLLVAVMLLAIVFGAVTLITLFTDREVAVPVALTEQPLGSASGATLATTEGELTLTEATTGQVLLVAAPLVLGTAVVTGAAYCLLLVVRSLRTGTPFHRRNARRLMTAALIVLFGGVVAGMADTVGTMALAMDGQELLGDGSPLVASASLPLAFVGIGLLLLCLAEFFRRGTQLAEDVEGLV
ncbi:DUF2975 domain-containing protein [Ornithinimicrobium cryptoxanthini]|uniref:DUF2975 domain-containing protein n=1 Tax=Ornithinimicrobium cryptoxanthini TaxID=2934161 RepID=A0ABY4YGD2_9MICO|nr:DUF2975 domain-containing protein [Ornithinimicrobium cryptoxanthini]USQ75408.1 DUF2975 domain-containing protein [Ornithinimicrobium cryptoxanthini]